MKIVNLSAGEVLKAINDDTKSINHYRKDIYFGDENTLGLYYNRIL